jgi:hypothetical protein
MIVLTRQDGRLMRVIATQGSSAKDVLTAIANAATEQEACEILYALGAVDHGAVKK